MFVVFDVRCKNYGYVEIECTNMQLSASAEKRAIHEAWVHARKAQDAAKEAADAAMQSVEEAARVQKFLDPYPLQKHRTRPPDRLQMRMHDKFHFQALSCMTDCLRRFPKMHFFLDGCRCFRSA